MITSLEKNYKISWIITLLIALLIFYISSLTAEQAPGSGKGPNAVFYHIAIFFLLSFFLFISLVRGKYNELLSLGIIILLAYALLDEIHQFYVKGRSSSFSDVILDSIGIFIGTLIYKLSLRYRSS